MRNRAGAPARCLRCYRPGWRNPGWNSTLLFEPRVQSYFSTFAAEAPARFKPCDAVDKLKIRAISASFVSHE